MGFLIDTCIWIDVERGYVSPSDVALFTKNEPVYISPVILAELSFGAEIAKDERIRQKRMAAIDRLGGRSWQSLIVSPKAFYYY